VVSLTEAEREILNIGEGPVLDSEGILWAGDLGVAIDKDGVAHVGYRGCTLTTPAHTPEELAKLLRQYCSVSLTEKRIRIVDN